jgi:omega-6 fatty acid desaturase (delta-12 desaturase)
MHRYETYPKQPKAPSDPLKLSADELRSIIPAAAYEKSDSKAVAIFLCAFLLYWCFFVFAFWSALFPVRIVSALFAGLLIGILFIIGHDACHRILASTKWLNRLIGELCFFPSLVPYSAWEFAHNRLHHGWTNVRDVDYAWCPRSLEEYRQMSPVRQSVERFYRAPIGFGWNYFFEIWWKHLALPRKSELSQIRTVALTTERLAIILFFSSQVAIVAAFRTSESILVSLFLALFIPHLVWNWLMGFVIYLQHTHPNTHWFATPDERPYLERQILNTVHVIFPRPIGLVLHNMMEHTVHHVDQRIPLYRLRLAQDAICHKYEPYIIHLKFTRSAFMEVVKTCQLYDYQNHQWITFDGHPVTEPSR